MVAVLGEILLLGPIGLPGTISVLRMSVVLGRIAMLGTLVGIGMIAMLGMLLVILLLVGEPKTPLSAVDSLLAIWLSMTVADFDVLTALSLKVRVVVGRPIVSVRAGRSGPLKVTVSAGNVGAGNPDTR